MLVNTHDFVFLATEEPLYTSTPIKIHESFSDTSKQAFCFQTQIQSK